MLSTEMIIYQSPVLKRKGFFSRACILVLTDFPRLLYFDDSNHYFSQVFNSNKNDAFNSSLQQRQFVQWGQESQTSQQQQHPRKSTSGIEGLTRNGSSKLGHQQARSEYTPGHVLSDEDEAITQQGASTRPARASLDHSTHHHHQRSHSNLQPQQTNGHNKIDFERRGSDSGQSSTLALAGATESSAGNISPIEQAIGGANGAASSVSRKGSSASPSSVKASKRAAKLRGEIFFTASVVSETKGKKCFFIHTNKKSYYFEELKEGDADRWVKVLSRRMKEWFGELGGDAGTKTGVKSRRQSKLD